MKREKAGVAWRGEASASCITSVVQHQCLVQREEAADSSHDTRAGRRIIEKRGATRASLPTLHAPAELEPEPVLFALGSGSPRRNSHSGLSGQTAGVGGLRGAERSSIDPDYSSIKSPSHFKAAAKTRQRPPLSPPH